MFGIGSFYETQAYECAESDYGDIGEHDCWGSRPYVPRTVSCKHCHKGGFTWIKVKGKWRMRDATGNIHSCLIDKRKAEQLEFKKKVTQMPEAEPSVDEINGMLQIAAIEDKRDNFFNEPDFTF